jgi:predicted AlkP superfamily pyrophosphatase or phosphodiesterase
MKKSETHIPQQQQQHPLIVIDIVGLTPDLLGENTPNLNNLSKQGFMAPLEGVFPAITTTAQATMLTGLMPAEHGIVGNGWYFRDESEIRFWLQSNHLVQGEKIWQKIKKTDPDFQCSKLFWWYNMYAGTAHSITPRPHYPADGRKVMGLYSDPSGLHHIIEDKIGTFPFFNFWGPTADIRYSRWIVDCAIEEFKLNRPNLQLVYLPHLDYNLQRLGPDAPECAKDVQEIDHEAGRLIDFALGQGADIMVVSEYGITAVDQSISLNRTLREAGLLQVRQSLEWELLDPGASRAFAVADHQIAHIYIKDHADIAPVKKLLGAIPGVERVLDATDQALWHINHPRSGELIAIAEPECWFDYYYWLDDNKAPDFAHTVDIHRKPGYDPVELFVDPALKWPKLKVAGRLIQKKLGMRMLMDVIPLTPNLVKGSHGRITNDAGKGPLLLTNKKNQTADTYEMQHIFNLIERHFGQG